MRIQELETYDEIAQFNDRNECIGFASNSHDPMILAEKYNIWIMETYRNKRTGEVCVVIYSDDDETIHVVEFD